MPASAFGRGIVENERKIKMTHRPINRRALTIAGLGTVASRKMAVAQPATPASPVPATPVPSESTLYRVDIPLSNLPPAPIAVGAASTTMTPGTIVTYAEGAAGQSVAIDHVLSGGYEIETDSELFHIDASGELTEIGSGETTSVAAGETIVLLQNEAKQRITAGDDETSTIVVGFFSLSQGTNETTVEGTLEQGILGGTLLQSPPELGVTVTVVQSEFAGNLTDSVVDIPFALEPGEEWTAVVLPLSQD